jgi:hypothetical protein
MRVLLIEDDSATAQSIELMLKSVKHFGKRRLGRSGLADADDVWDNVFHEDVSKLIAKKDIHSAVFDSPKSLALLEKMLRGVDRKHFGL